MSVKEEVAHLGVCKQHRERMQRDEEYREAALTVHPDSPIATGKHVPATAPLKLSESQS